MNAPSLTLLLFAPRPLCDALCACLWELGYAVRVDPNRVAGGDEGSEAPRVAICLFAARSLAEARAATLAELARWSAVPRLGVFAGEQCLSDPEIVFHCNEFALWPCPYGELDLRLKRLGATPRKGGGRSELHCDDLLHLNLIGQSQPFRNAVGRLKRFAQCDAPVLIEGETGTGKELAARAIHYLSQRREHPFIPVNCGALPDTLLENELFGHAKGAFTDARERYTGLVAQAESGTLFLDEIESLTLRGQVALLRFLQEMEYRPLGSPRTIHANVRVIAATNVPVEALAADRGFRQDLLYRLNIMPVCLPPLRERADDVALLAEHFLADLRRRYGQPDRYLHTDFVDWLRGYQWPGNVRELENLLHRQFLLSDEPAIRLSPASVPAAGAAPQAGPSSAPFNAAKAHAIEAFEREYLSRSLTQAGGNVTLAAKRAGKERRAFGRLLKKHGISRKREG